MDRLLACVCTYLGAFTAQMLVNRRMRRFLVMHFNGIYRRLGRIETTLKFAPEAHPETDPGAETSLNNGLA